MVDKTRAYFERRRCEYHRFDEPESFDIKITVNQIRCPNCAFANAADLNFCLDCGAPLRAPRNNVAAAAPEQNALKQAPESATAANGAANQSAAPQVNRAPKAKTNRTLLGAAGCLAIGGAAAALLGLLFYLSAPRQQPTNVRSGDDKSVKVNRGAATTDKSPTARADNSVDARSNDGDDEAAADPADSGGGANETASSGVAPSALLTGRIGDFERQGAVVSGSDGGEFVQVETMHKAVYQKNNRRIEITELNYADQRAAKNSYTIFFYSARTNAKIIKENVLKDRTGETGQYVLYTFEDNGKIRYEALFYTGKFGFYAFAFDRAALDEFLLGFNDHAKTIGQ